MSLILNGGRPIEILLIDDSPDDAAVTMKALRDGRVRNRVSWVDNGEEGIAFLARQNGHADAPRPDLILLDLGMPRMNGHEVLAVIKKHADWKRIPVVMRGSDQRPLFNRERCAVPLRWPEVRRAGSQ